MNIEPASAKATAGRHRTSLR